MNPDFWRPFLCDEAELPEHNFEKRSDTLEEALEETEHSFEKPLDTLQREALEELLRCYLYHL